MSRLYNLDYLRGIAAFSIMLYHYQCWTVHEYTSDYFMGRVGIYGVAIFYVLSGLTLFHVYYDKMLPSRSDISDFATKRLLRIFPLLWLVTLTAIALSGQLPDWNKLFLVLSGVFGFVKWDANFSTGVYSIGNELVFYTFFPLFVFLTKKNKLLMFALALLILSIHFYFAFSVLDQRVQLKDQWPNHINPLNQLTFFLGGFLIGLWFRTREIKTLVNLVILLTAFLIFIFYPAEGNKINLVSGVARIVFTLLCFLICLSVYKSSLRLPDVLHKPLSILGEISYSVYLLHPLVFSFFNDSIAGFPAALQTGISMALTLLLSYFTYHYFEKYFMKLGRKKKEVQLAPLDNTSVNTPEDLNVSGTLK